MESFDVVIDLERDFYLFAGCSSRLNATSRLTQSPGLLTGLQTAAGNHLRRIVSGPPQMGRHENTTVPFPDFIIESTHSDQRYSGMTIPL